MRHIYLRNFIIVTLFLILLTPLIYYPALFFPYVTGKNFYFRILVEIIFAAYIILATTNIDYRPRRSLITIAIFLLGMIMALTTLTGIDPYRSFWSNFERMEGYVTTLHLIAFFIVASAVLDTQKIWTLLWKASLSISVLVGLTTFVFHANSGALGNSSYLAIYMLMHVFIAAFLWMQQKQEKYRFLYAIAAIFDTYMLYQTGCRGAFLGFLGGTLLTLAIIAFFESTHLRKAAGLGLVFMFLFILMLKLFINTALVQQIPLVTRFAAPVHAILHGDFKHFSETEGGERILIWQIALQGVQKRPLLGWGPENFGYVYSLNYPAKKMYNQDWFDRVHSVPIEYLVTGGILGLLGYLSLFAALLYTLWKKCQFSLPEKAILTGLTAAYFIHNLFIFDQISSYIIFFFLLAYVDLTCLRQGFSRHAPNFFITPIMIIALFFVLYFVNFKPYMACMRVNDTNRTNVPDEQLTNYQEALSYDTFGNLEIREKLSLTALDVIGLKDAPFGAKRAFFDLVNSEFKKQITKTPKNARPHVTYGAFLSKIGMYDEALSHFQQALVLSPGKLDLLLGICAIYLNQNDLQTAFFYCKTAFDKAPEVDDTRITYAIAAVYADKEDLVLQLLDNKSASKSVKEQVISKIKQLIEVKPDFQSRGEYFINRIQSML